MGEQHDFRNSSMGGLASACRGRAWHPERILWVSGGRRERWWPGAVVADSAWPATDNGTEGHVIGVVIGVE
jgi:hypothetical protein